jgi:ABC-type transporter MlaC component
MIQMVLKLSLILGISLLGNISFSSETFQSPELLIQNISQPLDQLSQNQKIRNDTVALQKNLEKLFEPHFAKSSLLKHIFGAPWVSNNYSQVQESGDVFFKVMITELAQVLSQYDRWKISFNSLDDKQQHSQYRFAEKLLSSDTDAVATLDFVSENHAPNHFYMRLNRENGDWKISDFAHNNQSLVDSIRSNNISKLSEDSLIRQFVSQKKTFYANQSDLPSSGKKSKNKKGKVKDENIEMDPQEFGFHCQFTVDSTGSTNWPSVVCTGGPCDTADIKMHTTSARVDSLLAGGFLQSESSNFLTEPYLNVEGDGGEDVLNHLLTFSNRTDVNGILRQEEQSGRELWYKQAQCVYGNIEHYKMAIYNYFASHWKSCPNRCGIDPYDKSPTRHKIPKFN